WPHRYSFEGNVYYDHNTYGILERLVKLPYGGMLCRSVSDDEFLAKYCKEILDTNGRGCFNKRYSNSDEILENEIDTKTNYELYYGDKIIIVTDTHTIPEWIFNFGFHKIS